MINRTKILLVGLIVFLTFLLSLPSSVSNRIKTKFVDFLSPFLKGSDYLIEKILFIKDIFTAVRENKNLRTRLTQLSIELNRFREIREENERLIGLLNLKKSIQYETIACRVIARDVGTWYKTLIIDKGKSSGINPDMSVLGNNGLIGRVIDCGEETSRVLLITDINSSIGGIIQRTRAVGIIEGDGVGGCVLSLIPKKADVKLGDVVVTSGFGQVPKGLPIGEVVDIYEDKGGLYKVARIDLYSDIDRIEEVLVVKTHN